MNKNFAPLPDQPAEALWEKGLRYYLHWSKHRKPLKLRYFFSAFVVCALVVLGVFRLCAHIATKRAAPRICQEYEHLREELAHVLLTLDSEGAGWDSNDRVEDSCRYFINRNPKSPYAMLMGLELMRFHLSIANAQSGNPSPYHVGPPRQPIDDIYAQDNRHAIAQRYCEGALKRCPDTLVRSICALRGLRICLMRMSYPVNRDNDTYQKQTPFLIAQRFKAQVTTEALQSLAYCYWGDLLATQNRDFTGAIAAYQTALTHQPSAQLFSELRRKILGLSSYRTVT